MKRGLRSKTQRNLHEMERERNRQGLRPAITPCEITLRVVDDELGQYGHDFPMNYGLVIQHVRRALHYLDADRHVNQHERLQQDDFPDIKEFLLDRMGADDLKVKIQRREKATSKLMEVIAIEHTWAETVLELMAEFINLYRKNPQDGELQNLWKMLEENEIMADEALATIARTYNHKPFRIRRATL